MLKFVEKWLRETTEEKAIERDGTADKWTKCDGGLPDTNRRVQVIVYGFSGCCLGTDKVTNVCFGKFNPHIGWELDSRGVVLAWRDLDKDLRNMMEDFELIKKLGN
jgi:hypothetical protein